MRAGGGSGPFTHRHRRGRYHTVRFPIERGRGDAFKIFMEVGAVRVKITLACTECKQRNYDMTKEKKNHPDRMETKKYCRFCKRHTMHKETK